MSMYVCSYPCFFYLWLPPWQFCHSIAPAVFASCSAFAALFTTQIEIVIHSLNLSSWPRECHPSSLLSLPPSYHFLSNLTWTSLGIFKLGYTHTHTHTHIICHISLFFPFPIWNCCCCCFPLATPPPLFFHLAETTSNWMLILQL